MDTIMNWTYADISDCPRDRRDWLAALLHKLGVDLKPHAAKLIRGCAPQCLSPLIETLHKAGVDIATYADDLVAKCPPIYYDALVSALNAVGVSIVPYVEFFVKNCGLSPYRYALARELHRANIPIEPHLPSLIHMGGVVHSVLMVYELRRAGIPIQPYIQALIDSCGCESIHKLRDMLRVCGWNIDYAV
jgi:hypothetical protein